MLQEFQQDFYVVLCTICRVLLQAFPHSISYYQWLQLENNSNVIQLLKTSNRTLQCGRYTCMQLALLSVGSHTRKIRAAKRKQRMQRYMKGTSWPLWQTALAAAVVWNQCEWMGDVSHQHHWCERGLTHPAYDCCPVQAMMGLGWVQMELINKGIFSYSWEVLVLLSMDRKFRDVTKNNVKISNSFVHFWMQKYTRIFNQFPCCLKGVLLMHL